MVPPQVESLNLPQHSPLPLRSENNNRENEATSKLCVKPSELLYSHERLMSLDKANEFFNESYINKYGDSGRFFKEHLENSKRFSPPRISSNVALGNNVIPPELVFRDSGIFAVTLIPKGTRYGPFQGKWAGIPQDAKFAWEVSQKFLSKLEHSRCLVSHIMKCLPTFYQ